MKNSEYQFVRVTESWYGESGLSDGLSEEVIIGDENGEIFFRWTDMQGNQTPFLVAYCESWKLLRDINGLFTEIAQAQTDDRDFSPEDLCKVLLGMGIKDATRRENPRKKDKAKLHPMFAKRQTTQ